MAGIDKAAIGFTVAIIAIALGITASMGVTQDASPIVSTPPTVSTEISEPEASTSFGADLAAKVRAEAEKTMEVEDNMEEETMMEEAMEEETMMEEAMEEETMMEEAMEEETAAPQTHIVDAPAGTSVPGCEETNSCFTPADITINVGDTVEWNNVDTAAHTVTSGSPADGPSGVFDSSLLMADATFAFTFEDAGNYDYFCMVHPWMVGSVSVN